MYQEANVNVVEQYITMFNPGVFKTFFPDGEIVEVRIPDARGRFSLMSNEYIRMPLSGYFDDHEMFCSWVKAADKELKHGGIFFTLQVIDARLSARSFNRIRLATITTTDKDAHYFRWLPVDLDSVRPPGISATDDELHAALSLRDVVADYVVTELGFSSPIRANSGNGGHLLFRLPDIPVTDDSKKMIRDILNGLAQRFNTDRVKIDTTVFNPARIWKCYGTTARKGDPVPAGPYREARPHRVAYIETMGDNK
jgi:hypothetical protein